jgi:hypothetical protein
VVRRWAEECRIVQEAQQQQLNRMVAPGSLLYRLVQDHGTDMQGMDPLTIALTARAILAMPAAAVEAAAAGHQARRDGGCWDVSMPLVLSKSTTAAACL